MGAEPLTMAGLDGIGDLMVTCASPLSRIRPGMTAEGISAYRVARALARDLAIEPPLFERVDRILHEGLAPRAAIDRLMPLPAGHDVPVFVSRHLAGPAFS